MFISIWCGMDSHSSHMTFAPRKLLRDGESFWSHAFLVGRDGDEEEFCEIKRGKSREINLRILQKPNRESLEEQINFSIHLLALQLIITLLPHSPQLPQQTPQGNPKIG